MSVKSQSLLHDIKKERILLQKQQIISVCFPPTGSTTIKAYKTKSQKWILFVSHKTHSYVLSGGKRQLILMYEGWWPRSMDLWTSNQNVKGVLWTFHNHRKREVLDQSFFQMSWLKLQVCWFLHDLTSAVVWWCPWLSAGRSQRPAGK